MVDDWNSLRKGDKLLAGKRREEKVPYRYRSRNTGTITGLGKRTTLNPYGNVQPTGKRPYQAGAATRGCPFSRKKDAASKRM